MVAIAGTVVTAVTGPAVFGERDLVSACPPAPALFARAAETTRAGALSVYEFAVVFATGLHWAKLRGLQRVCFAVCFVSSLFPLLVLLAHPSPIPPAILVLTSAHRHCASRRPLL